MSDAKLLLDHAKMAELIMYISQQCLIDPEFCMAKLKAVLFFADFIAFRTTGTSITGEQYVMENYGRH